jgi:hypothetical protein
MTDPHTGRREPDSLWDRGHPQRDDRHPHDGQTQSFPAEDYYRDEPEDFRHGTGYAQDRYPEERPPRRKRRIFLWVFLAIQALFIIWLTSAIVSVHSGGGIPAYCARQNPNSPSLQHVCADAADTGSAIGFAFIIVIWAVADIIIGGGYGIYRLARSAGGRR